MKYAALFLVSASLLVAPLQAQAQSAVSSIVAVVNDQVISTTDVEKRVELVLRTTRLPDNAEVRKRLRPQLLKAMIDERLQLQEAQRRGIEITPTELAKGIATIEEQRGMPNGSLLAKFREMGVPVDTFKDQLRAQLAWAQLVLTRVRPRVRIAESEIIREQNKLVQPGLGGHSEVYVMLLNLPVDKPEQEGDVRALAERLAGDIRSGVPFESVAGELSGGAGRSGAVEPFWLPLADMEPNLAAELKHAEAGKIVGPVRTSSGYLLVKLVDSRGGDASAGKGTVVSEVVLKDILLRLKEEASKNDVDLMLSIGREVAKNPGTCADPSVAGMLQNSEEFDIDVTFRRERVEKLTGQLRDIVQKLEVGEVSDPYASAQGIRLFILCEKVEAPVSLVNKEEAKDRLFREKLELEAQKYLRGLRRDATIDVRRVAAP